MPRCTFLARPRVIGVQSTLTATKARMQKNWKIEIFMITRVCLRNETIEGNKPTLYHFKTRLNLSFDSPEEAAKKGNLILGYVYRIMPRARGCDFLQRGSMEAIA